MLKDLNNLNLRNKANHENYNKKIIKNSKKLIKLIFYSIPQKYLLKHL